MLNIFQENRLKKAGFPFELVEDESAGNIYEGPGEKELMEWLGKHRGKLQLCKIYPTSTGGWRIDLYKPESIQSGDYETDKVSINNADLTECLIVAVEKVLKTRRCSQK